ncbi:hypothetical protein MKZ38_006560 [Zalerion maritima]|uniref:Uncharacterized protein n=1 Tax=Zalerion maritima TaxID=339359 RepID=A0AAD5S0Y2_9PEZI|nr:hypothetical protein MKZ38_006560 [Zalerion maritima]
MPKSFINLFPPFSQGPAQELKEQRLEQRLEQRQQFETLKNQVTTLRFQVEAHEAAAEKVRRNRRAKEKEFAQIMDKIQITRSTGRR